MKHYLVVIALCFALYNIGATTDLPNERIANGKDTAGQFLFSCNIFVLSLFSGPRIGGGTIVSNRHVVTTAKLVSGKGNTYRIDYRHRNDENYRHIVAHIAVSHNDYNPVTLENDIAIVILPQFTDRFPYENFSPLGEKINLPGPRLPLTIVGHGFTSPDDTEISRVPYFANYTADGSRDSCNVTAPTMLCLYGGAQGVLCPGDVGSGVFSQVNGQYVLVGIVANLPNDDCTYHGKPLYSSYIAVGFYKEWIETISEYIHAK